jgi:uncharacterized protein (TIGR02284 family)
MIMQSGSKEKLLFKLNQLAEINNHRIQGYEKAISETEDEFLANLFINIAAHSRYFKSDLSKGILLLGGETTNATKTSDDFIQAWIFIKAALLGKRKKEILESCEFEENLTLETYKAILNEDDHILTDDLRRLIEMQRQELQLDCNLVKELKESEKINKQ